MDYIDQAYENLRKSRPETEQQDPFGPIVVPQTNPETQAKIKQIEDRILNKPAQEVDYLGEGIANLAPIAASLLFGGEASRIALPQTVNQSRDIYGAIKKDQQAASDTQDKRLVDAYGSLTKQSEAEKQRALQIQRLEDQRQQLKLQDEQKRLDREQRALDQQENRDFRRELANQSDLTRRENAKLYAGLQQQNIALRKAEEKNIPQNVSQAASFATRLEDANKQLEGLIASGYDPTSISSSLSRRFLPEIAKGNEIKLAEQAQRNFINAALRRESGAAIQPSEFESADKQYFPVVGDSPEVLEQKKRNREVVIAGLKAEGAKALPKLQQKLEELPAGSEAVAPTDAQSKLDSINKRREELLRKKAGK